MRLSSMTAGQVRAWLKRMGHKAGRVDAGKHKWGSLADRKAAVRALGRGLVSPASSPGAPRVTK